MARAPPRSPLTPQLRETSESRLPTESCKPFSIQLAACRAGPGGGEGAQAKGAAHRAAQWRARAGRRGPQVMGGGRGSMVGSFQQLSQEGSAFPGSSVITGSHEAGTGGAGRPRAGRAGFCWLTCTSRLCLSLWAA